jgi:hypothetical protein
VPRDQDVVEKWMTRFWCLLLLPWIIIAPLSGMAFDAGYTTEAYIFVWSVWTYPIILGLSVFLKRKAPVLAFLPAANFLIPVVLAAFHDALRPAG